MINCITCGKETKNEKFCSRSCHISNANKISPKVIKATKEEIYEKRKESQGKYINKPDIKQKRKKYYNEYRKNNLEYFRKKSEEYVKNNPNNIKNTRLKASFGITLKQYNQMLESQNGVCAICHQPETTLLRGKLRALSVDHDHKTGKIRELLCGNCNRGLGCFNDSPEFLRKSADYIERYKNGNF